MIVPLLADGSHIDRLKVPQLTAVLAFKTVEVPKGSIKADLQKLAKDALKLPMSKEPTPLLALPAPPTCNSTIGDEITQINGRSVLDAAHQDVINYMGEAAAQGEVTLKIRRKVPPLGRLVQGSPADQSGQLYQFDELISVNGQDVSRMDHSDVVTLIKASGTTITLEVQQPQDLELVKQQQLVSAPL
ncbi:hypothetical protein EMCRGX_G003340 [Ephydatia muelleri]